MFKTIKQRHIDTSDFYLEFTHVFFDNFINTTILKVTNKGHAEYNLLDHKSFLTNYKSLQANPKNC